MGMRGRRDVTQGQHLIKRLAIRHESSITQADAGGGQRRGLHSEMLADRSVRVVTQALAIGNGDEKEIERRSLMAQAFEVPVTDQTVIHPTELRWSGADAIGVDW